MALACVLDASAAVRLTLGDAAASGLAESIRSASPCTGAGADAHRSGQHALETSAGRSTRWPQSPAAAVGCPRAGGSGGAGDRHLQAEALALACHLNHPVVDCLYLALARREAATLVSADRRLNALAERVLP
ncbi:MAG: type II toxin-antitoxin system VapC family toxin [Cyanobium sp.]